MLKNTTKTFKKIILSILFGIVLAIANAFILRKAMSFTLSFRILVICLSEIPVLSDNVAMVTLVDFGIALFKALRKD